ncbi:MAG: ComEA family DNA-binding protein [Trueperaceae bacterium]
MDDRRERALTLAMAGLCLLLATVGLVSHLAPGRPVPTIEEPPLQVAVSGAVRAPGSYELPWGTRVDGLIREAGGLADGAAEDLIRPAVRLVDGERVHVPYATTANDDPRISLNEAHVHDLERLPGIGPALAGRIVADRPFHRVDDLLRVRGIGPATLRGMRDRVRL